MSKIVGDTACPACRSNGRDRTGNHLMIFEDGSRYCNRCGYGDKGEGVEEQTVTSHNTKAAKWDWRELLDYPVRGDFRGIKRITAEHFDVRQSIDEVTGDMDACCYPYHNSRGEIVGFKVRRIADKTFFSGGNIKGAGLFGQSLCTPSKFLVITEGEEDAMAAWQMFKANNTSYDYAVVSLRTGANIDKNGNATIDDATVAQIPWMVDNFGTIVLCLDNDKPGQATTAALAQLIGPKARIMTFSEKDANDMLLAGKRKEFIAAFWNAKAYVPDGFVTVDDVFNEAITPPKWGRHWPWESLDRMTYGRRDGEGIYVGAGVKIGKSEWLNEMIEHIIEVEGGKIALFKFEEEPALTVRKIAGKLAGKSFHRPDVECTSDEIAAYVERLRGKLVMYDNVCATGDDGLWERIKLAIRHAVLVEGCRDVFIDPITNLTDGLDSAETERLLRKISNELAGMAKSLGFFYYCFCHLKSPTTSKPHEEGGKVHSNQFRGSRAMMEKTHMMLGIERNKLAEDELEKNTSRFVLLENRTFGITGAFEVFYDMETGSYRERPDVGFS